MTTLELLQSRHSVRSYSSRPISEEIRNKLRSEVTFINTHESGLNFQLCFGDDAPFRGAGRSYGMFRNVRNYLAVVIDPTFSDAYERAGYFAEQFVIEALKSGLGSCYVGGTFSRQHVDARVEVYEKIPFVVSLGYPEEGRTPLLAKVAMKFAHRKSMSPRDFFDGNDSEYESALQKFPWLSEALQAVACAPSSLNKRPVRLKVVPENGTPHIAAVTTGQETSPVDLGIAKYNVASVISGVWDWGNPGVFFQDR